MLGLKLNHVSKGGPSSLGFKSARMLNAWGVTWNFSKYSPKFVTHNVAATLGYNTILRKKVVGEFGLHAKLHVDYSYHQKDMSAFHTFLPAAPQRMYTLKCNQDDSFIVTCCIDSAQYPKTLWAICVHMCAHFCMKCAHEIYSWRFN